MKIQVKYMFIDEQKNLLILQTATDSYELPLNSIKTPIETHKENWNPDWDGDPDDPNRWKGW